MKLNELVEWSSMTLELEKFSGADSSLNGLQVGRSTKEVHKVCFAVDASLATFEAAAEHHTDALFVHHGLFWGEPLAVTGNHYQRIRYLIEHDIALLAAHLPLDAHPSLGNNAVMATRLGIAQPAPFGMYHGMAIGWQGSLPKAMTVADIVHRLDLSEAGGLRVLPFGPQKIRTVGIVSGGASFEVLQAIDAGLDAYVTGESGHSVYSACQEAGITMICGGHYATEVFGVRELAKACASELGLETEFLALPTAL